MPDFLAQFVELVVVTVRVAVQVLQGVATQPLNEERFQPQTQLTEGDKLDLRQAYPLLGTEGVELRLSI